MSDYLVKIVTDIQDSQKEIEKFTKGASAAFAAVGAIAAAAGTAFTLGSAIKQAAEFQQTVKQLEVSLQATGQASERTVQGFVEFASGLQQVTKFSDDTVLSTATLIQNIGQLEKGELKRATKAALDLSVAIGVDAANAAALLGKAANGNVSALKKFGIEITKGKTDAETFANALATLEQRFGGASEKSVKTFSGALSQLRNNIDDSLKTFGQIIITNDAVIESIQLLSSGFISLTETISQNSKEISNFITVGINGLKKSLDVLIPVVTGATAALSVFAIASGAQTIGFIIQFAGGIAALTTALKAMTIATLQSTAALLANPIVIGAAAVGAIAAFAARVFMVRDSFVSLTDAIIGTIQEFTGFLLRMVGAQGAAKSLADSVDRLKQKKVLLDTQPALDQFDELNAAAKAYRKNLDDTVIAQRIAAQKVFEQQKGDNAKLLEETEKTLKNSGKNQVQILLATRTEQLKIISDGERLGNLTRKQGNELRLASEAEFQLKMGKYVEDQRKKQLDEQEKYNQQLATIAKEGSSNITGFINNFRKIRDEFGGSGTGIAAVGALASSVKEGAEGARQAVVGALTAAATAFLGPIGQALGPVFDLLSQGPEKVREMVTQFVDALPTVIENIVTAAPVIIDVLAEKAPEIIQKLVEASPRMAAAIAYQMSLQMPFVAVKLATSLVAQAPNIARGFMDSLIAESGRFIQSLIDGVKNAFGQITSLGGGGGLLGGIGGAVASVGKRFGFASGGMPSAVIGGGYPKDSFPINVESGEGVARADTMARLDRFLQNASMNQGSSGGGVGTLIVKAVIGEQELATSYVNLQKAGYRLSV